jgi:2-polyprenyl-3-methyl-5-hydroxy-6-metoxy-1,4-benzoquinol methylase
MRFRKSLVNFVRDPHMPWLIIEAARKASPFLAKFLQYGRLNINTQRFWDKIWDSSGYQETEDESHRELRSKIIELITPETKVLDVGCGAGSLMQLLRDRINCDCTGIDISRVAINIVRNMGFYGFVTKLPDLPCEILDRKFDFVTAIEIFEHLYHPEKTLRALKNVIKPGGKLIVTVPNDTMKPEETDDHVNSFTVESLRALVKPYFGIEKCIVVKSWVHEYIVLSAVVEE